MTLLLWALGIWVGTGVLAAIASRHRLLSSWVAATGTVAGTVLAAFAAVRVISGGLTQDFSAAWSVPFGAFAVRMDALSAWFVLVIVVVSALAAVYGIQYLASAPRKKPVGLSWFYFNLLVGSMVGVVIASNAVLFLVTWEVMALSSFFLVTFDHEEESVRDAGWIYLVATHLGTAFLLVFFLIIAHETGTMDFVQWSVAGIHSQELAGGLFVLAVVGFGAKAGFMPLHVWLPAAHPAAPSHVSAVMSGVMIKTGIYGLLRSLKFLGPPPLWWGWTLVGIGLCSGILGVLFALAQHDLKRLLAYHSVENIGIITLGIGLGFIGTTLNVPALIVLGFGGGLLHVLNHALFKSLLFLGAGSVLQASGTRNIESLGGLLKRMPWTALTCAVGAAAICALPPFNGFLSEFLIYLGALKAGGGSGAQGLAGWLVVGGLGLIGGLAAACFTKAFGIVFLGQPRSECAVNVHECKALMRWPMALLAAACLAIGLGAGSVLQGLAPAVVTLTGMNLEQVMAPFAETGASLRPVTIAALTLVGLALVLAGLRRLILSRRDVREADTWDCGYARPTARMQYTASSFAAPLTALFRPVLRTAARQHGPTGLFPGKASFSSHTADVGEERFYAPIFRGVRTVLGKLHWLQHGTVQLYILYIALALLALLIWKI